jgi:ATP-dependent Clp protease ATP-binding subunit ClpC
LSRLVQRGADPVNKDELSLTPRAEQAIENAREDLRALGHNYVGTEHLLLGVMRETEGVAAQILSNLGIDLDALRRDVLDLLGYEPGTEPGKITLPKQWKYDLACSDAASNLCQ